MKTLEKRIEALRNRQSELHEKIDNEIKAMKAMKAKKKN